MATFIRFWQATLLLGATAILSGCAASGELHHDSNLNELITAGTPGNARLSPAWAGESHDTIRTGSFTSDGPDRRKLEHILQFNWYVYPLTSYFQPVESKILTQSRDGQHFASIYTWRATLPTDAELTTATTLTALEDLLGPSHDPTDSWGSVDVVQSTAGWRFFTMRDAGTIETVSIFCTASSKSTTQESHVDSMLVMRGIATPVKGKN